LGELLRAAIYCVEIPSLLPKERNILGTLAFLADDSDEPTLELDGTIRPGRTGLITRLGPPGAKGGFARTNIVATHIPLFKETGWIREVEEPTLDGAYQLNLARLGRLLDLTEAAMVDPGGPGPENDEADQEKPGDFLRPAPEDLREQIDRLLVRNPLG